MLPTNQAIAAKSRSGSEARTTNVSSRFSGTITKWQGNSGWITSTQKIHHPQTTLKGDEIYFGAEDVKEELSGIGAKVSFFVYADATGFGATDILRESSANKTQDPAQTHSPLDKIERKALKCALSGVIAEWKGQVGWIQPDKPIEHPLATNLKHGHLYVHQMNVEGMATPEVGSMVRFSLYCNAQGLSAQNCKLVYGASARAMSPYAIGDKPLVLGATKQKSERCFQYANRKIPEQSIKLQYANAKAPGKSYFTMRKHQPRTGKPTVCTQGLSKTVLKPVLKVATPTAPARPKVQGPRPKAHGAAFAPQPERQRLPGGMILGKVVQLKDEYGWIILDEPSAHPKAASHDTWIYLSKDDFVAGKLMIGTPVKFYCYTALFGLGAEQCTSLL